MALSDVYAWLEDNPSLLYGAQRPQTGSLNFLNYWRNQQPTVYGDYQTKQIQGLLGGSNSNQSFMDYMQNYPFMQNFMQLSPAQRGERPSLYAPRTRWQV